MSRCTPLGRPHENICYATSNRQRAVRALAQQCDVIVVLGASRSSNSLRLREVAIAAGLTHIENEVKVNEGWFENCDVIGVTSGASVPEVLVQRLLVKFCT
jgi:4-hydroxy-3-methylbut-2-enyl diphosphate reductase